ncbi:hypothetical protein C2E23DRAFT_847400 [Lenzites betulinus]|nr:hypothetical protein C2E23DRAFT_847400 [Lenzites betulinus]
MSCLDGYSLQLSAPPHHPSIGIAYPVSSLSRSNSARSISSSLKRKRSDDSMAVTITVAQPPHPSSQEAPLVLPIIFPSVKRTGSDVYPAPLSPAATEIIEAVDEGSDVCMVKAKAAGVKVRDFAHEPLSKGRDIRAPEVWNTPLEALILHDRYIRVAARRMENYRLSGKLLHRLLAIGWVTQEEADAHWREEDWQAVSAYVSRPLGAYPFTIPSGLKKPTASYRAALRLDQHVAAPDDLPEDKIIVPADEPGMDDGPARVDAAFLRRAVIALNGGGAAANPAATSSSVEAPHVDKKQRLNPPESTPPTTPPRGPCRTPTVSRSATPPARPPRLTRARGLARTETLGSIA